MTTATIPQRTIPQALTKPTPSGILRLLAMCGERGYTITTGEAFQVAMDLVRRGLARYFDVLGAGVPVFVITEAGKKHLRAGAPAPESELRAALTLLITTAEINASKGFDGVPRVRRAKQACAWHHRDFGGRPFPYPEAFEYLRTTHHIEPVTTWSGGSRWTVGWALTARGRELHARLSSAPQPIPATRALVVSPPRALVVAGHFRPIIPTTNLTNLTPWQWRQKYCNFPQVKVQGRKGKRYWVVRTPDGERHDSLPRTFYTDWKAREEGEAFAERWWNQHAEEASCRETFEYHGVTVELKQLRYTRGGWWKWRRTDGGCGEGLARTKREAVTAAQADIDHYKPDPKRKEQTS